MPVPSCFPRPGRRLGPKIRSTITRTMAISRGPMLGMVGLPDDGGRRYYNLRTRLAFRITPECIKFVNGRPIYMAVMSQPPNSTGQYVRRVTLPSGRSIEVVYFEPLAAEAAGAAAASSNQVDDLHICPECDRDLV